MSDNFRAFTGQSVTEASAPAPAAGNSRANDRGQERALRDLSHVLAHRLRSLVSSIEGYTDLLADTLVTPEQREMTQRLFEGTARIEHVLADLQRYSQSIDPVRRTLEIDEVVHELRAAFSPPTRERIEVVFEDERLERVDADPVLLRQALLVLLQNALEAVAPTEAVQLLIAHDPAGPGARFSVWNHGFIEMDRPADVFLPFLTTKSDNLGVGLPIARRIALAHRGHLNLEYTDPRRGTCFSLWLPVEDEEAKPVE